MNAETLRQYRKERANGTPAKVALANAKYVTREPAYDFLAELDADKAVSGTVGPFTVSVKIVRDEDGRLGDDDVTGTFVDSYIDGCVKNTVTPDWNVNGQGCAYYLPSEHTRTEAYKEFRTRDGMSKGQARQALATRIQAEMYADAHREWFGVAVKVSLNGRELAVASLWGIDSIPDYDPRPYLIETAEELIEEAIDQARTEIPGTIDAIDEEIEELTTTRAALAAELESATD